MDFLFSIRGRYIVAQALFYGTKALEEIEVPYQETSNLNDMKYLKESEMFGIFPNFSRLLKSYLFVSKSYKINMGELWICYSS